MAHTTTNEGRVSCIYKFIYIGIHLTKKRNPLQIRWGSSQSTFFHRRSASEPVDADNNLCMLQLLRSSSSDKRRKSTIRPNKQKMEHEISSSVGGWIASAHGRSMTIFELSRCCQRITQEDLLLCISTTIYLWLPDTDIQYRECLCPNMCPSARRKISG